MDFIQILEQENFQSKFFPKGTVLFHEGEEKIIDFFHNTSDPS